MSRGDPTTQRKQASGERRVEDCYCPNQDEPLVRGRIKAVAEGEINQRREGQHACEGDSVKRYILIPRSPVVKCLT